MSEKRDWVMFNRLRMALTFTSAGKVMDVPARRPVESSSYRAALRPVINLADGAEVLALEVLTMPSELLFLVYSD